MFKTIAVILLSASMILAFTACGSSKESAPEETADKLVWDIVGGSSTIPQTIVLDRDGTVIYNQVCSVTPELLESLYSQASAGGGTE